MERILLIGCPGSGKSTLARNLSKRLGLPLVHLDSLYWGENWQPVPREQFDKLLLEALEQPRWIVDGNFERTQKTRMEYADTVIFLNYSRWTCLRGVLKRIITNYGTVRPDMGPGCRERFDWDFIGYTWNFQKTKEQHYLNLLEQWGKNTLVFSSRKECRRWFAGL